MPHQGVLDHLFQALADPTRRAVIERLGRGPTATSELASPFAMALPSFIQHLDVLERAGLVRSTKEGRVRTYRLTPQPLQAVEDWMATQRRLWERRLDQFDDYVPQRGRVMIRSEHAVDLGLDLVLERDVDAPPELVWAAWTRPEHVKKWFAPKPYETVVCEIDLRPGGIFRTVMRSPEGALLDRGDGCVLEVVENRRFVWTAAMGPGFRPVASDLPFTAIITIEPAGPGTRYRAVAVHGSTATRIQHEAMGFHEGWGTALDQLVEVAKALSDHPSRS